MEGLQLSETEQRYFGDLFLCCDADNSGKIPKYKASELFRTANLPIDVLKQIFELCGAGTHLGRRQFYAALKLVAASQAGMTLQPEMVHRVLEVPLPRFTWTTPQQQQPPVNQQPVVEKQHRNRQHINSSPDLIQLSDTDPTPTPVDRPGTGGSGGAAVTSDSEAEPPSGLRAKVPMACSPEASSTASDSPTPTNSVQERGGHGPWVNSSHHHWQGLENEPGAMSEEQRELLGTEEESSDRHSSDEDDSDEGGEVWVINAEQREYYTAQFRALQPDPSGLLAGHVARLFFEKSRLPVAELRRIWQLADVSKDGALSLEEFNTAMHLVVLRRNSIPLPSMLPPCLQPPLLNLSSPPLPPPVVPKEPPPPPRMPVAAAPTHEPHSPPSISPLAGDTASPPRSKEWTKFADSPTSSVSSPGPKPVNFDFHKSAVEQDPKILHPVPLRVTPESQGLPPVSSIADDEGGLRSPRRHNEGPAEVNCIEQTSPKRTVPIPQPQQASMEAADIRPIQRPQPKKPAAVGRGAIPPPPHPSVFSSLDAESQGGMSGPASLPMPQLGALPPQSGPRKEPPPPPPPRPHRTHTRSSSLDLNTLGKAGNVLNAPPVVPPRISPSMSSPKKLVGQRSEGDAVCFADFAQFGADDLSGDEEEQPRRHGAFEVYRKPQSRAVDDDDAADGPLRQHHRLDPAEPQYGVSESGVREHSSALSRLCVRLGRELLALQEEHASLRVQLDALVD